MDPKKGKTIAKVTRRGTKKDFALFVTDILKSHPRAGEPHLVMDNHNNRLPKSIKEAFDEEDALQDCVPPYAKARQLAEYS